ncbi:MAG: type IX secretion system membrane protein PorP/SprF [Bacteroidetes bacterium]|nr:MAG: type IX secretion system membrane protein PorP/SprF [Bacteroidota bacterium]
MSPLYRDLLSLGLFLTFICGLRPSVHAQDPQFSQFFNTPLHINPAYVGANGGITATATYRHQWNQIPGGFNTTYLSVDSFEPCLPGAFGLSVWQDAEGEGILTTTAAQMYFGFVARADTRKTVNNFRFALSPYWMQKEIDWDRLVFSDQLDPRFGNINATAFQPNANLPVRFAGLNFGFVHRLDIRRKGGEDIQLDYGLGLHNLLNVSLDAGPIESLQGLDTGIPLRWSAHASVYLPFLSVGNGQINRFRVVPQVRAEGQGGITSVSFGAYGLYQGGAIGLFYHNQHPLAGFTHTDALIAYVGLGFDVNKNQAVELGLSYNLNMGGLRTQAGGVFELNLRYYLQGNSMLCGIFAKGNLKRGGRGRKGPIQCPPVGRSHHRRWNNIWYRNG